ncbi:MAG: hypothetical protein ABW174_07665, partial [Flavitalea sp.]
MIQWHHKTTGYSGIYEKTVNTFRKADLVDVSLGFRKFGMQRARLKDITKTYPRLGFHKFLIRRLISNLFRHPLRPLPMFRI